MVICVEAIAEPSIGPPGLNASFDSGSSCTFGLLVIISATGSARLILLNHPVDESDFWARIACARLLASSGAPDAAVRTTFLHTESFFCKAAKTSVKSTSRRKIGTRKLIPITVSRSDCAFLFLLSNRVMISPILS